MSKPVKELIRKALVQRLEGVGDLAVVSVVGIDGNATNDLRGELREQGIHVLVVKNALARQAFEDLGMPRVAQLLEGPCALAYGGESVVDVVREMLRRAEKVPTLQVRGACMEGDIFGPERVTELSQYPTRSEALGRLSRAVTSPAANLVAAAIGPSAVLAGILKKLSEAAASEEAPQEQ